MVGLGNRMELLVEGLTVRQATREPAPGTERTVSISGSIELWKSG